jgi:hypothetical protein
VAVYQRSRLRVVGWWAHVDLNHGPHPYQGCALTGLSYGPLERAILEGHAGLREVVGWSGGVDVTKKQGVAPVDDQ